MTSGHLVRSLHRAHGTIAVGPLHAWPRSTSRLTAHRMRRFPLSCPLLLVLGLGCDDKPTHAPSLPPALLGATASANAAVDAASLVEGPLDFLGLRLPLGTRPIAGTAGGVFDIPAPVEHVDRYLRARIEAEKVERAVGARYTYERAKLRLPSASATPLPLRIQLKPTVAGTRLQVQEEATGLPATSAQPDTREMEIVLDQLRYRSRSQAAAGATPVELPTKLGPDATPPRGALQASLPPNPVEGQSFTITVPEPPPPPDDGADDE